MAKNLMATPPEVQKWLLATLRHSLEVEYFFHNLGIGGNDPQRPHDLVGEDNKFELHVLDGLALQYRLDGGVGLFHDYIRPSRDLHRHQYHHQKWESPNPLDNSLPNPLASEADLRVGGVDSVCAIMESRGYQEPCAGYHEVARIIQKSPPHKIQWILAMLKEMEKIPRPDLTRVVDLKNFPNIGLPTHIYEMTRQRIGEALEMLSETYHHKLF